MDASSTEMDIDNHQNLHPLVQAPMDSPLNRAHAFSRRAEMLTKSKRFDDAISCLSKAGECVLLAMKVCASETVLESLSLQHKSYLSQIDRLRTKAKLLDLMESTHRTTATISQSTQTDSMHNICADQTSPKLDTETIYEILRENQHLMKSVAVKTSTLQGNQQQQTIEGSAMSDKSYKSVNLCESDSSDGLADSEKSQNSWKLLGDGPPYLSTTTDVSQCDNLVQMNRRLNQCVTNLLQELTTTHAEKKKIEEKLCVNNEILAPLSEPSLKFSCLSFPPLESLYPEVGHFSTQ